MASEVIGYYAVGFGEGGDVTLEDFGGAGEAVDLEGWLAGGSIIDYLFESSIYGY